MGQNMVAASELNINENANAIQMAQTIFGDGVTVISASYSGDDRSLGIYTDGDSSSPGVTPGDTGIILSTGRASSFTNSNGQTNQSTNMRWGVDNTEMDGFAITMTLTMVVIPGVENSIRIGVANVSDSSYDSNLLIAGDSIQTDLVAQDDSTTMYTTGSKTLDVLANDVNSGGTLVITHINGQPVVANSTVLLNTGQTIVLNPDGTISILGNGDIENFAFTYAVSNGTNTGTGIVTVDTIPCFVAGTRIQTPDGPVVVEDIQPGDLVMTRDEGPQPVPWSGQRHIQAQGNLAPIHIRAGTFGQHNDLLVPPQHRVLVRDSLAELLFGEGEVLVAAKDLLNDHSVTRQCSAQVTYVHLRFDQHQIIFSEGLETERFLPGPETTNCLEQPIVDGMCEVFPELDPVSGQDYATSARRTLQKFEAQLLLQNARAA
jgi:hypothetical protein